MPTNKGSNNFSAEANDFLGLVETIAQQNIRAVESTNLIEDAFYEYEVDDGKVIEEAIIEMAEAQAFVPTAEGAQPDLSPLDPKLYVKYFNEWKEKQFKTTLRRDEIRAIIAKGESAEAVASRIMGTLTSGEGDYDYGQMRAVIEDESVGVNAVTEVLGNKMPKNMKGVMFAIRKMFNAIKATNDIANVPCKQGVPVDDIRIAISEDVLALIDMVELANLFNLSKEEILGKVVKLPYDPSYKGTRVLVYDRKALGRATRLFEYGQDVLGLARYSNHGLTTSRAYFYNALFKCLYLDIESAVVGAEGDIMEDATFYDITETLSNVDSDNVKSEIAEGGTFKATYTAKEGYTLEGASVSVTMGGSAVANAYDDGVVTIANVSGDIAVSITAVAEE